MKSSKCGGMLEKIKVLSKLPRWQLIGLPSFVVVWFIVPVIMSKVKDRWFEKPVYVLLYPLYLISYITLLALQKGSQYRFHKQVERRWAEQGG